MTAIVVGSVAILVFGGVGALHGDTVRLYVATSQARGLIRGSDVWLEGQRVGRVTHIGFRPPSVDTSARLLIQLEMLEDYVEYVRRDSYAQIRSGGTLIGQPVLYVTTGTSGSPAVMEDDTIPAIVQADFEGVTSQLALASQHFPAIIRNVKMIGAQMEGARGTLGALGLDENRRELDVLRTRAGSLQRRVFESEGSIALTVRGGGLLERARLAMARADSVKRLVSGSLERVGRFRRDSTLAGAVADLRNEVSIVRARLANAEGTAGRITADSAIFDQLARLEKELSDLMRDIKSNPSRYIHFD